jgi:putative beta-barrel porin BBP2
MPQIRLSLSEDFTDSSDFRDVGNVGTTRTGQTPFITNRATAEAAYTPPQGQAALSYTNVLNREDVSNPDNSDTHIVRASGDLVNPRLGLGGSYTLTRGLFTVSSDYWENSVEGHANRSVSPTVTANLSGEFTQHNADQPQAQDFSIARVRVGGVLSLGPSGSLSAQVGPSIYAPQGSETLVRPGGTALWTQRFSYFAVSVGYSSGFKGDFQSVDNTGVSYVQSGSVYLTSVTFRDLTATGGARWNHEKFEQTSTNGGPAGTKDTTWDLEARLEYILARPLVLTLGYIYTIRSSTDPTKAFVENRVRLGITYRYNIF